VPGWATLDVVSTAPAGAVATDSPLVQELRAAGDLVIGAKQAWTNVADFTARGIPAVNFGPGHTAYAHHRDEQVTVAALVRAYETLSRFFARSIGEDGL